jgi:hypothetical protein
VVKEAEPCTYLTLGIETDALHEIRTFSVSVVLPFLPDCVVDVGSVSVVINK